MARLLVLDTDATQDAGGSNLYDYNGVALPGTVNVTTLYKSQPIRLFGPVDGPVEEVLYEFLFEGAPLLPSTDYVDMEFWQEFFNDTPKRTLPSNREAVGVNSLMGWSRETAATTLATVDTVRARYSVYDVTRKIVLADGTRYFGGGAAPPYHHAFQIACPVKGLYTRFVLQFSSNNFPAGAKYRLRTWAVVGGHDQADAQDAGTLPYVPEL